MQVNHKTSKPEPWFYTNLDPKYPIPEKNESFLPTLLNFSFRCIIQLRYGVAERVIECSLPFY